MSMLLIYRYLVFGTYNFQLENFLIYKEWRLNFYTFNTGFFVVCNAISCSVAVWNLSITQAVGASRE